MRATLAWVMLMVLMAACNSGRPREPAAVSSESTDAAASVTSPVNRATAPPLDGPGAAEPFALAGAKVAADSMDQDATGLGTAVEVQMLRLLGGQNGSTRMFTLRMVLRGVGTLVIPIDGPGFGQDGYSDPSELPAGTLEVIAPLGPDDDRDPSSGSMDALVPTREPLLFRFQFHIPGANDFLAVVHDDGEIHAYYYWEDEGTRAKEWELIGSARLAKGAKVTAR